MPLFRALLSLCLLAAPALADGLKLLTVHKLGDSFGIYDVATGKLETEIPTSVKPHEFALDPSRRYAFITDYGVDTYTGAEPGGNTITIVDLHARAVAGRISTGAYRRPHAIELAPSGLFYITTEIPAAVHVLDPKSRKILRTIPVTGKLPHMIHVNHGETKAWTADSGSGTVSVIDLKAGRQTGTIQTGGVPMGFAASPDEKTLYLAAREGEEIVVIDAVKDTVAGRIPMPGRPGRLLMLPGGRTLAAALIGSDEAALIDTATRKEIRRQGKFSRAEGMTLHPDGRSLWIAAQMDNKVVRLSLPDLKPIQEIATKAKPDPLVLWMPPAP
jgi:YVTN family beta-propeller protein